MSDGDDKVRGIGAARFDKSDVPQHLNPRAALEKALEVFDTQADIRPDHIIVIFGRNVGDEGCSGTSFYQAGSYRHHGQMGLLMEGQHMIRESGQ